MALIKKGTKSKKIKIITIRYLFIYPKTSEKMTLLKEYESPPRNDG